MDILTHLGQHSLLMEHQEALDLQQEMIQLSASGRAIDEKNIHDSVQSGTYPHVSFIAAGCAQAIRLVSGMAAFDRCKIGNFKFEAINRAVHKIHQSSHRDFKTTALIRSTTRSRMLLPGQSSPLQKKVPSLFLKIDFNIFFQQLETMLHSIASDKSK